MTMVFDEKNNVIPTPTEAEVVPEKTKQLLQEYLKEITVTSVAPEVKAKFQAGLQALTNLIHETEAKKAAILDKKRIIREKLELLKTFKSISFDENEFDRSIGVSDGYISALDKMIVDMERDLAFSQTLISDAPPKTISVFKFESDDFGQHLEQRILSMKKFVKTTVRDLAISFSRYSFNLDSQLNHLNYVEQVALNREKLPAK